MRFLVRISLRVWAKSVVLAAAVRLVGPVKGVRVARRVSVRSFVVTGSAVQERITAIVWLTAVWRVVRDVVREWSARQVR